jgi:hypothetical protein
MAISIPNACRQRGIGAATILLFAALFATCRVEGQIAIEPTDRIFDIVLKQMTPQERTAIGGGFAFSLAENGTRWSIPISPNGRSLASMFTIDGLQFVAFYNRRLAKAGSAPIPRVEFDIRESEIMGSATVAYRFWVSIKIFKVDGSSTEWRKGQGRGSIFSAWRVWKNDRNPLSIDSANEGFIAAWLRALLNYQNNIVNSNVSPQR